VSRAAVQMRRPHKRLSNKVLGYPDDARLLLVNADDFGMYPAMNEAIIRAFKNVKHVRTRPPTCVPSVTILSLNRF
jgi:hypothetical protein